LNDYSSHDWTVAPTRPAGKGAPSRRAGVVLLLALILSGCAVRQPAPPSGETAAASGVMGGARYMAMLDEREPGLHGDIASELRKRRREGRGEAELARELAATLEAHVQARLTHVPDRAAHALYSTQLGLLREAAERTPRVCPMLLRNTLPPTAETEADPDLLRRWAEAGLSAVQASYEAEVATPEPGAARSRCARRAAAVSAADGGRFGPVASVPPGHRRA